MELADATIVVWSDIGCPWAHVAISRLHRTRRRLGLEERVAFDHRAFPLELVNEEPTPRRILAGEVPVLAGIEPDAGWQIWQAEPWEWPVTMLPALEAVQAAKEQGLHASDRLDRALRVAFFGQSRCISLRHILLDVAREVAEVDAARLEGALDDGSSRAAVMRQFGTANSERVIGSPHLFLPDGSDVHNPGIEMHWQGEHGEGTVIVDDDDPSVYEDLLAGAV